MGLEIKIIRSKYYRIKISELDLRKHKQQNILEYSSLNDEMKEYTQGSKQLFKNKLYKNRKEKNVPNILNDLFVLHMRNL